MDDFLDRTIGAIAGRSHGLFARIHLDLLGASEEATGHRLAHGRWIREYDGVYRIAGAPRTWESKLLAACWAGGNRACASRSSAAALYTLPGGRRDVIEITCPHSQRARHEQLIVHESRSLLSSDITFVAGIPCTTVERTLFDMASTGHARTLDLAIDAALRRELTTLGDLMTARERLAKRGRRGSVLFKEALSTRTPDAALPGSEPERLLAIALVRQGLPQPQLQYDVRDRDGAFIARVDLAYPEWRILIEYDSFQEHTGKLALIRDSARRNAITALGFQVLTATAVDVRDEAATLSGTIRRLRQLSA
jgi:hypothetical protein